MSAEEHTQTMPKQQKPDSTKMNMGEFKPAPTDEDSIYTTDDRWKDIVYMALRRTGRIEDDFTGTVMLNIGVQVVETEDGPQKRLRCVKLKCHPIFK